MFGSSPGRQDDGAADTEQGAEGSKPDPIRIPTIETGTSPEKRSSVSSSPRKTREDASPDAERKRRTSGVARARDMFSSAKQHLSGSSPTSSSGEGKTASSFRTLERQDPALAVPQGPLNNSAGVSSPTPRSTFRVGVTEDKNKKCRRTMEDTHAYLYNFMSTPQPALGSDATSNNRSSVSDSSSGITEVTSQHVVETDNGYFAIFDGHAGTFAADWCGKKLHILLEDIIRKNPNTPIPELLDQTFTTVDQQLEKLPLKNSGCTAVIAVLRWEDRVPSSQSATGSASFAPAAAAAAAKAASEGLGPGSEAVSKPLQTHPDNSAEVPPAGGPPDAVPVAKLQEAASRQRVLYTANVGDARIVLCRNGRALRLSYDHKGSDENEGRRVANAGGLILNNRVNGVLAVTRALGDAYMKDLVTGHPYTTETVIQPDQDEFLILACDGLWDVCSDQEAVDLIRNTQDPQAASRQLVDHALARFSTDNLSCMVVRFDNRALKQLKTESSLGVEGDHPAPKGSVSEAEAIVATAKKAMDEVGSPDADKNSNEMIMEEEEEAEPGPELNVEALKKAQVANKHKS
ncbi:hypothetical protein W97_03217 [Coniosporium apollinis CBS 100218]|uniref:PPM-type phosphatase domain-containing protein n=1 Tax=Coniosporium apollinis (strain CBS 100218) TaxID=1168221 RepID=R7YQ16_CONA1|nr:uncharacterized protein W97_03217 [Coniosporium apollinis CBS 100218]EON63987.1 hypothetical protein W97_03217 [Coniosporium apollinis CBS 100218]